MSRSVAADDGGRIDEGRLTPNGSVAFRRAPRAGPSATGWATGPDDRLSVRIDPLQPTLPWDVDSDPPAGSAAHRPRQTTPSVGSGPPEAGSGAPQGSYGTIRILRFGGSWAGPPGRNLPDPAGWSVRLTETLLEAISGIRPISQLDRWLAPPAMTHLTRRARRHPIRDRACLQAIHLHRIGPARAEVVAVVSWPDRRAAMAFRLDGIGGRWLCSALDLSALRRPRRSGSRVSRRA